MLLSRKSLRQIVLPLAILLAAATADAANGYYYSAKSGETLSSIARRHNISVAQLASANRLRHDSMLASGTRLWVPAAAARPAPSKSSTPAPKPRTTTAAPQSFQQKTAAPAPRADPATASSTDYVVRRGDTLWGVANKNGMSVSQLASLNGIDPSSALEVGQVLRLGGAAIEEVPGGGIQRPSIATASAPAPKVSAPRPSSRGFIWPVEGRILRRFVKSSEAIFTGIDIEVPRDTEVRAMRDGKVVYSGNTIPSYGRMVIVQHEGGTASCYGQLGRALVQEGQQVRQGQVIARTGQSKSGESLLHLEIRKDGEAVNPEGFLP